MDLTCGWTARLRRNGSTVHAGRATSIKVRRRRTPTWSAGVYNPYPTNANPTGEAYPNSLDLFPDAEPNSVGSGFDPTGMTVFDGNVYFSGVNAAGKTELWELVTNTPAEPFWEQTFNASSSQVFLAASGLEFTGINGASSGGI